MVIRFRVIDLSTGSVAKLISSVAGGCKRTDPLILPLYVTAREKKQLLERPLWFIRHEALKYFKYFKILCRHFLTVAFDFEY